MSLLYVQSGRGLLSPRFLGCCCFFCIFTFQTLIMLVCLWCPNTAASMKKVPPTKRRRPFELTLYTPLAETQRNVKSVCCWWTLEDDFCGKNVSVPGQK